MLIDINQSLLFQSDQLNYEDVSGISDNNSKHYGGGEEEEDFAKNSILPPSPTPPPLGQPNSGAKGFHGGSLR